MTIRQIAAIAGVSKSTVSLVLNNSPLVNEKTRHHVKEVIRRTGYVPNNSARNLSRQVNNSLGIIVLSDQQRSCSYDFDSGVGLFSSNIIRGISSRLTDSDYSVVIEYFYNDDQGAALPKLIRERKIDGALIVGGFCQEDFIAKLNASGIPFVTVAVGMPEGACDSVVSDPELGAYLSIKYLYEHGHTNIAFLNCPSSFRSAKARINGINRLIGETSIPIPQDHIMYCKQNNGVSAYKALKAAWEKGLRFDGIATANPQIALGAVRYLREMGVALPEDVSIVSYEDNSLCGYTTPALTALNIQKEKMGELAADLLLERINNPEREVESLVVDQYMVERDSVKTIG